MNTSFKALAGDGDPGACGVEARRRVAFQTFLGVPGAHEHPRRGEQEQRKSETTSLLAEHVIPIDSNPEEIAIRRQMCFPATFGLTQHSGPRILGEIQPIGNPCSKAR